MELQERIQARITEVKQMHETFVVQANLQIAVYQAVISELEKLLISDTLEAPPTGGKEN